MRFYLVASEKKGRSGFITVFLIVLLIGLGVIWFILGGADSINSTKEKSDTDGMQNSISSTLQQIASDSKAAMKSATKKLQDSVKSAANSLQEAINGKSGTSSENKSILEIIKEFFSKLFGWDSDSKNNAKINTAKNNLDSSSKSYDSAKSKDNVFKDSIAKLTENPNDILPYVLAVVFIVLIVILLLKKPAPKQEVPKDEPPTAKVEVTVSTAQGQPNTQSPYGTMQTDAYSGRRYEGVSEPILNNLCSSSGIPKDYLMSVYGDVDVALARLNTYLNVCDGNVQEILKRIEADKGV